MIEIDRNLHLYGEKAWRFAVWLAKQLPAGMSVTTVDDFTYDHKIAKLLQSKRHCQ